MTVVAATGRQNGAPPPSAMVTDSAVTLFVKGWAPSSLRKPVLINYLVEWFLARTGKTPKSADGDDSRRSSPSPTEKQDIGQVSLESHADVPLTSSTDAPRTRKGAWVTLLTGEQYLAGLLVFSASLLHGPHASAYPLVVMVTDDVTEEAQQVIREMGCEVRHVEELAGAEGADLAQERFSVVWTKLRAFELEEFERVILIDSDMLVMRNMDELMDIKLDTPDGIAASFACTCNPRRIPTFPDFWKPENCAHTPQQHPRALTHPTPVTGPGSTKNAHLLNSGLVVLTPSRAVMAAMVQQIATDPEIPSMRFPDQDFLAKFYRGRFMPLPWCYNALKTLRYCHPNAWRDDEVRCLHYILDKPWTTGYPGPEAEDQDAVTHSWWWQAYEKTERTGLLADDAKWQQYIGRFVNAAPKAASPTTATAKAKATSPQAAHL